ncbi:116 kDa U5 small nuclear ribonucleoprotein component [Skeletonema marinoi]|uniref:116 kDa U5 small nuclear ribonucleoprotein component n=1 Tax=Skeletonema marinoi TaxID=267567 RepID=A0AAD8YGD9_9STRA|nr:116 kDa U5 small nuclear ribonucleoprotein component [Skeletonema marinoi]
MADNDQQDLYDEFGNYVGPDLDDSSSDDDSSDASSAAGQDAPDDASDVSGDDISRDGGGRGDDQLALHGMGDKVHYPSAEDVYGEGVRTAVLDEDTMDLEEPIVEPVKRKNFSLMRDENEEREAYGDGMIQKEENKEDDLVSDRYLASLVANETTRTRRSVALVGHLHTGKTSLVDLLIEQTKVPFSKGFGIHGPRSAMEAHRGGGPRTTDTLQSEQDRQLSIKSCPITLCLPDTRGKTYALTTIDCPGHTNFHDESVASLRVADGAALVVDAIEGIMLHTEMLLRQIISEGLPLVLIINKIDRLVLELKLPPDDMYHKLRNVIDSVNAYVSHHSNGRYPKLSPDRGNVIFASSMHGYAFSLESFAAQYLDQLDFDVEEEEDAFGSFKNHGGLGRNLTPEAFAKRLWGNAYLDPKTRTFHGVQMNRTFVQFVLEPLYKMYTLCLGEPEKDVEKAFRSLGVLLGKEHLRSSARPLMRVVFRKYFGTSTGFVDTIVQHVPSPAAAAKGKVARCYSGPLSSRVVESMIKCDSHGPLVIHVAKLYAEPDGQSFSAFGRIYSGSVKPGDRVKVLGEAYTPDDDEDMAFATSRKLGASWWSDSDIIKTATIVGAGKSNYGGDDGDGEIHVFSPLKFPHAGGESTMKLAVEPLNPAELPKMIEGLRRVSKSYPMSTTRVEESGEHILFGTGELYLDCLMHDLRTVYSDIEVKVADPVVGFRETVVETSSIKCTSETANKRNTLTFTAEPLDDGLAEKLEAGKVNLNWDNKKLGRFFQTKYDWDLLSSRSVWAFGSSPTHGTNILLDDTLPSEVDKSLLLSCKPSIVQGFQWATREGPLCEEPVRSTKFKILDVALADKGIHRGGGQIIPTARKTVHSALLTATPRLMEPWYQLQIQCPGSIVNAIQPVLAKRRGHIVHDKPIPGSPLFSVKAFIPVLDSFGFETDLRTFTQGQAMVHSVFDHWAIVPGDPLDKNIVLYPLEPSPPKCLARDFLVKTRRRKGLSDDVSLSKFFDEGMREQLLQNQNGEGMTSSVSSAVAIPGRDTITEAIEVAATSRRNSALEDDVCADNCVVGIEDDDYGRTNASDDATRAVTRTDTQQDFMI